LRSLACQTCRHCPRAMEQSDHHHRLSPKATASAPPLGQLRLKRLTLLQYYQLELEAAAALAATRSFEYSNLSALLFKFRRPMLSAALVLLNSSAIRLALMVPGSGGVANLTWPGHWHCKLSRSLSWPTGTPSRSHGRAPVRSCCVPASPSARLTSLPAGWMAGIGANSHASGACRRIPVA
jgi:hypothetical protein